MRASMRIETFRLERWQSLHEHRVEINLSDSGVAALSLRELVSDPAELDALLDERLVYTQTNGTPELRRAVAALHAGAGEENVEVTNGGSEANFVTVWTLVEPGDEVVVMQPNYQQVQGLASSLGARVVPWRLRPDLERGRWTLDLDELASLVTARTRLIAICNPSNPTGHRLDAEELDAIARVAETSGAWVLSDEVYRGAELAGDETPTLWGRCEHAVVTGSLSKSYGLPGLRVGWLVAPPGLVGECWKRHDYTTIAPSALGDRAARMALRPVVRERLLARARGLLGEHCALVRNWLEERPSLRWIAPRAGAIAWLRHGAPVASAELARRLLEEKSTLVVPGEQFDLVGPEGWLRIGFGGDAAELEEGLRRIGEVLDPLLD